LVSLLIFSANAFTNSLYGFIVYIRTVKAARFIFALYIVFMTVYPCNDQNTCADERKAGVAFVDTANHNHTSEEQDFCTPFCICSCCAAHVQLTSLFNQEFSIFAHNTKQRFLYFERSVSNTSHSVWQPPKV